MSTKPAKCVVTLLACALKNPKSNWRKATPDTDIADNPNPSASAGPGFNCALHKAQRLSGRRPPPGPPRQSSGPRAGTTVEISACVHRNCSSQARVHSKLRRCRRGRHDTAAISRFVAPEDAHITKQAGCKQALNTTFTARPSARYRNPAAEATHWQARPVHAISDFHGVGHG